MGMIMDYDYSETVKYLQDWFLLNARILAWRENKKPYYIWISEIMLQQTRVEAVKNYFDRFVNELPEIKDLAIVSKERLMKLWEGLGYYNRVRNMQKAAIVIMEEHGGELPADYGKLLKLPGIGSYTAGAISSIAFGLPEPAVDGNVLRVMKRVSGSFDDITMNKVRKELENDLREIIPKETPGEFNQAIMELGALICLPNGKPLCEKCPIIHLCIAYHDGTERMIPVKTPKKARKIEEITVLVIEQKERFLLHKRQGEGLLAGMFELPNIPLKLGILAVEGLLKEREVATESIVELGEAKHIFSHIEWHMTGYYIKIKPEYNWNIKKHTSDNSRKDQFDDLMLYESNMEDYGQKWNMEQKSGEEFIFADKKQIANEISLPSAFEAYRSILR